MSGKGKLLVPWYSYPPFRDDGIGGLSVVVWELTRRIAGSGIRVEVLTPEKSAKKTGEDLQGVMVRNSGLGTKLAVGKPLTLEEVKETISDYDSILSVGNFGASSLRSSQEVMRIVRRQVHTVARGRPLSTYVSMNAGPLEYFRMFLQRRREQSFEAALSGVPTICVSKFVLESMVEKGVEKRENLHLIGNGVDTSSFRPLGLEKRYDLLFVGRFQRVKGLDVLLSALSISHERGTLKPGLAIAGGFTGEERKYVLSLVPAHVRPRIEFLGVIPRRDMPRVLNSTRILVVPSRLETFGLPALEAISCGIPVLASRVGGLPEIVHEEVGVLFTSENSRELAKAVEDSLLSDKLTARALQAGPIQARIHDWRIVVEKTSEFLFNRRGISD